MRSTKYKNGARRIVSSLMMAGSSTGLFLYLLSADLPDGLQGSWAKSNIYLVVRYVVAMTCGGAVTGYFFAPLFGRHGVGGWLLSLFTGALCMTVSGALGSGLGLLPDLLSRGLDTSDFLSFLFGFLVLPIAVADHIGIFSAWLLVILSTHCLVKFVTTTATPSTE